MVDVLRLSIEVNGDECRPRAAQEVVLKDGTYDAAGFGRLGFGGVPPRVPIRIVDVNKPSSLAFAESDQLGPTQAMRNAQAGSAGIKAKDCVRGATNLVTPAAACSKLGSGGPATNTLPRSWASSLPRRRKTGSVQQCSCMQIMSAVLLARPAKYEEREVTFLDSRVTHCLGGGMPAEGGGSAERGGWQRPREWEWKHG